jgi:hypothetical protein
LIKEKQEGGKKKKQEERNLPCPASFMVASATTTHVLSVAKPEFFK